MTETNNTEIMPSNASEFSLATLETLQIDFNEAGKVAVNNLQSVFAIAKVLTVSGMIPTPPKGVSPEQTVIETAGKIIAGARVGLDPFQACQSIAIINGGPCLWGDAMMALVQQSGLLEDYREEWIPKQSAPTAVKVTMKRKGVATEFSAVFTLEIAKAAGLTTRQTWKFYTADMLLARARSRCIRRGFADILGGLYSADEARDGETTSRYAGKPSAAVDFRAVRKAVETPETPAAPVVDAVEAEAVEPQSEAATPTPEPVPEKPPRKRKAASSVPPLEVELAAEVSPEDTATDAEALEAELLK